MKSEAKTILEAVKNGTITVDEALLRLKTQPFDDLGFAKVDMHRSIRQGAAEVIYGAGKTPDPERKTMFTANTGLYPHSERLHAPLNKTKRGLSFAHAYRTGQTGKCRRRIGQQD